MELSAAERIMMEGLMAREREIEREHLVPLRTDYSLVARMIESRIGLPAGSVGTKFSIDMAQHALVENQPAADIDLGNLPVTGLGDKNSTGEDSGAIETTATEVPSGDAANETTV